MTENSFLGSVAHAYASEADDLSEYCFIFPNRRSGTFFLKHLSEETVGETRIAPEVMTVGDFMARLSGMEVAPRIMQLMELYQAYRDVRKRKGDINSEEEIIDFDKFLPWGEVVLSDFNDIDMYGADAAEVLKNVEDYRTIATDFLTEEQKEVIDRYFGYIPESSEAQGFWKTFDKANMNDAQRKYLELWQVLPELYTELRRRLEHPGEVKGPGVNNSRFPFCMSGSCYRLALESLREERVGIPWKRIVVVGLDWLSVTEGEVFSELRKMKNDAGEPLIEFFWDITGPVLENTADKSGESIRRNRSRDHFPEPEWAQKYMKASKRDKLPELTEIAVPSNAAQAKVAGEWVRGLIEKMKSPADSALIDKARVAVVLPDENMLLPLLYSLPLEEKETEKEEERGVKKEKKNNGKKKEDESTVDLDKKVLRSVNLTMGWSMRYTSTAAFMYHLERLHRRRREWNGETAYMTGDLKLFIAQPLVQLILGTQTARELNSELYYTRRRLIPWREINEKSPVLGNFLKPMSAKGKLHEGLEWLDDILLSLDAALAGEKEDPVGIKTKVERMQVQIYMNALWQIGNAAERCGIDMNTGTLFHLLSGMTAGEKVSFEGEPLAGLQVMGLMETRAMDFDKVIILSMNDKVVPSRGRKRSFIPDSLRHAYGLPSTLLEERNYAYWFYRLLSRAGQVTMVYDSRVGEGMRSGGKSRFLMQLEKLHARDAVKREKRNFTLSASPVESREIQKSPSIMEKLEKFKTEGGLRLSATALGSYMKCPVQFFYRFLLRYGDEPERNGFVDAITQGNIFHDIMLHLYLEPGERNRWLEPGKTLAAEALRRMLDDEERLELEMRRSMVRSMDNPFSRDNPEPADWRPRELTADEEMVGQRLLAQVKGVIREDLKNAPVLLRGGELKRIERWRVNDDLTVNMTGTFDRVDLSKGADGRMRLRIVDFKTGSVHVRMKGLEDVFEGERESGNILQLLMYARMLEEMIKEQGRAGEEISVAIFDTNRLEQDYGPTYPYIAGNDKGAKKKENLVTSHKDPRVADFADLLNAKIEEIFDPEVPFRPCDDPKVCEGCVMAGFCRR